MSRSAETGRVLFTFSLPLKQGVKVYEFAEKMDVGANKVLQALIAHAIEHASVKKVGRSSIELVFDDNKEAE